MDPLKQDRNMSENKQGLKGRLLSLIRHRAYKSGQFKLASGRISDFYFDGKQVELMPEGAYLIGELVYEEIKDGEFDAIGGLAVGAVPMVTSAVISCFHHEVAIEGIFVRPVAKSHGTQQVIEGKLERGDRVVIVDDVATSGSSLIQAIEAVEQAGATVGLVLVIVNRQEGAEDRFRERGLPFRSIFTKDEIAEADHVPA
jgi:orotate phosphoribosyltransferase